MGIVVCVSVRLTDLWTVACRTKCSFSALRRNSVRGFQFSSSVFSTCQTVTVNTVYLSTCPEWKRPNADNLFQLTPFNAGPEMDLYFFSVYFYSFKLDENKSSQPCPRMHSHWTNLIFLNTRLGALQTWTVMETMSCRQVVHLTEVRLGFDPHSCLFTTCQGTQLFSQPC